METKTSPTANINDKRCLRKTQFPNELLSTVKLTTYLLPTRAALRAHCEHPPDNYCPDPSANYSGKSSINERINAKSGQPNKETPTTTYMSLSSLTNKHKPILESQKHQKTITPRLEDLVRLTNEGTTVLTATTANPLSMPLLPQPMSSSPPTKITPASKLSHQLLRNNNKSNNTQNKLLAKSAILTQIAATMLQQILSTLNANLTTISSSARTSKIIVNVPRRVKTSDAFHIKSKIAKSSAAAGTKYTRFRLLPSLGATSFFTLLTLVCLEMVLLSTVSNCAKTFYMHWNTSNSIFRIDNTDHIIDVNKGNLAFEFDQVHIICPVYEPGTYENETEKYIIYNVSKVEYETCRITNADPRVIAICDKPQKLMFFTITFRPFTPQPGGLEFLPGNDYYFISTSSKDDLYRRIGGRCSTNNMKVVFKVCCAPEEKNKTSTNLSVNNDSSGNSPADKIGGGGSGHQHAVEINTQTNINQQHTNTIGISGVNTAIMTNQGLGQGGGGGINMNNQGGNGVQLKPMNGQSGTSINTNIDQFNRIPMQTNGINVIGNNVGGGIAGPGLGSHGDNGGIMITSSGGGHGGINMIPTGAGGILGQYPGHIGQTGIRINNVPSQHHPSYKNNINSNNNGKAAVSGNGIGGGGHESEIRGGGNIVDFGLIGGGRGNQFLPPNINTNHSNIVQSTMNWPGWPTNTHFTNSQNNLTSNSDLNNTLSQNNYYSPSHRPATINKQNKNDHYDKHPNEVVKNEELTYNSQASSLHSQHLSCWKIINSLIAVFNLDSIISTGSGNVASTLISKTKILNKYLDNNYNKIVNKITNIVLNFNPIILIPILLIIVINLSRKRTLSTKLSPLWLSSESCKKSFESEKSSYTPVNHNTISKKHR